jgi:cytochrome c oxidase subunit II
MVRRHSRARLLGLLALLVLLAGCARDAPQNYLEPEGPIAREADHLFKTLLYGAVIPLALVVEGWLVLSVVRHRQRRGHTKPLRTPRPAKLWLIVAPTMALMVADLFPLAKEAPINFALAREPKDALQIDVYGHMWWWEYVYPDSGVSTAHELHIPTGRPVRLTLRTIEPGLPAPEGAEFAQGVLHSFWVPKLAGKTDVVPGRANKMTIEAEKPGTYLGQCAEYCNLSHANMRLAAVAHEPADFEAWLAAQQRPAVRPASGPAAQGFEVFTGKGGCLACHTVVGVEGAVARVGPNLTHLKSRDRFGGYVFDNTPENLRRWVDNPSAMKPMRPKDGTGMPDQGLSETELDQVVAYLETLK